MLADVWSPRRSKQAPSDCDECTSDVTSPKSELRLLARPAVANVAMTVAAPSDSVLLTAEFLAPHKAGARHP